MSHSWEILLVVMLVSLMWLGALIVVSRLILAVAKRLDGRIDAVHRQTVRQGKAIETMGGTVPASSVINTAT